MSTITPPSPPTASPANANDTKRQPEGFSITLTPCKLLVGRMVPDDTKEPVACDAKGFSRILGLRPGVDLLSQLAEGRYLVVLKTPVQAVISPDRTGFQEIARKNPGLERRVQSLWQIQQLHRGGIVCET